MTRSECSSPAHSVCCGPDDQDHAEETSHEGKSLICHVTSHSHFLYCTLTFCSKFILVHVVLAWAVNCNADCTTADQSIEEQLLLIELKEVQRELLQSKQYAAAAHASADAASTTLRTQRESMHKVLNLSTQAKV